MEVNRENTEPGISGETHPSVSSVTVSQVWMAALEAHSAYSTHYCSQEPGSEEEDEHENAISTAQLKASLQVVAIMEMSQDRCETWQMFRFHSPAVSPVQRQRAEASRRLLEEEVTAFLSILKNGGLAESNDQTHGERTLCAVTCARFLFFLYKHKLIISPAMLQPK